MLESERHAERIRLDNEPEWAKYIDPAYLNGEYAHAFRDLEQTGAPTAVTPSIRSRAAELVVQSTHR